LHGRIGYRSNILVEQKKYYVIPAPSRFSTKAPASGGKLPALLQRLRQRLVALLKEERPDRHFDRAVKALPKRYAVRVLKKNLN
jgi:hypothetical protein